MSAELDMSQYFDLFLQEAEEQLDVLEENTLKLEADPSNERLQAIFRAAHTLKGSSRAMGFTNLARLTHEMENVLDLLRHGTLVVNAPLADSLLQCQDTLHTMVETIRTGSGDDVDCSELVLNLQDLGGTVRATPPSSNSAVLLSQVPASEYAALEMAAEHAAVYHAVFTLEPECAMKSVRALMAIHLIQDSGELLVTVPSPEKLEEEEFEHVFELVFQFSGDVETLSEEFRSLSEVASVSVALWSAANHSCTEKPEPHPIETPHGADANSLGSRKPDSSPTVRVDVARLDALMNLVGELVIDRTRMATLGRDLSARYPDPEIKALLEIVGHVSQVTSDLQSQVMKVRMMPIDTVFNRIPRVVRDLSHLLGKDINLEIYGGDTELDRSVIEFIGDPLLHIIRNSIDHGIESADARERAGKPRQGSVTVCAWHDEGSIIVEISDDGGGIDADRLKVKAVESGCLSSEEASKLSDREALQLVFATGLSTAAEVSEVSGRGVGMDIVQTNVQALGGVIGLESTPGLGTRFSLRLPLTLAIIRGLLVRVAEIVYVIPLGSVVETLVVERTNVQSVNQREVIDFRSKAVPLLRLGESFSAGTAGLSSREVLAVAVVRLAQGRVGLVVDELIGEQEVVIKSLSRYFGDVPGISGATILGDGNVALIVDVDGIVPK